MRINNYRFFLRLNIVIRLARTILDKKKYKIGLKLSIDKFSL
jgi:hypothetical protein